MGTRLRELRKSQALSQRDLAEKSDVSHATISRLELGHQKPTHKTVRKLADALGVEPHELLERGPGELLLGQTMALDQSLIEEAAKIWVVS